VDDQENGMGCFCHPVMILILHEAHTNDKFFIYWSSHGRTKRVMTTGKAGGLNNALKGLKY
jgi:hypothetical protein